MGANIKPIDPSMTIQKAITQGGYYNTDGDWNNVMTLDEHPGKIFRGRVEVLVLKDGKLFMYMKDNGRYRIPGGGFDKGVLNKDQAFIETKEEAKLIIDNIRFTGVTYTHIFEDPWTSEEGEIPYDGNYNEVYIATYKNDYHGYIRKGLSDMELTNKGKFYKLDEVENILKEPHKQALMNMLNGVVTENTTDDNLILTAKQLQTTLRNLHNKMDSYYCIHNRDIESDDGGWIFAEYLTNNKYEEDEVKKYVNYCNEIIRTTIYGGYVEEPMSYKGQGFLFIKNDISQTESAYLIDESCIEFFTEASAKMKEGKYPVFIVNSNVGTTIQKMITVWTQSLYAHSSITLDTSLENLYSFNRSGFVKESLTDFKNFNENTPIQVSCIFVKKEDIKIIKERLELLWSNKDKTKYDLDNIINIMFNRPVETAKDTMTLVCSQFVAWILSITDVKLMDKSLNLITPKDLANLNNPKVYKLYEGTVKDYDKKKIDRVFKKLKDKSQLIKND